MSSSIAIALRALGMLGVGGALVMVAALRLVLAVVIAPWRPMRRRHAVVLVDPEPPSGDRRAPSLAALSSLLRGSLRALAGRATAGQAAGKPPAAGPGKPVDIPVIGYATLSGRAGEETAEELGKQADIIARACAQRGLVLLEVVSDTHNRRGPERPSLSEGRPGLCYALGQIAAGDARGLVVPGLRRLAQSAAELGPIMAWFTRRDARLVAVAQGLDTADREARIAARLITEISRWEQERAGWVDVGDHTSPRSLAVPAVVGDDPDPLGCSEGESS